MKTFTRRQAVVDCPRSFGLRQSSAAFERVRRIATGFVRSIAWLVLLTAISAYSQLVFDFVKIADPSTAIPGIPANNPAFGLQFCTNLTMTNRDSASPSPVIVGPNNIVTKALTGAQKFFRLFKP